MKAIVCEKYGPPEVLQLKEVKKPTPKDDEVLISNYGSSINTVDIAARSGKAPKVTFRGIRWLIGLFLRIFSGGLKKPKLMANLSVPKTTGFGTFFNVLN